MILRGYIMSRKSVTVRQLIKIDGVVKERTATHIVTGAHGYELLCADGVTDLYNENNEYIANSIVLSEQLLPITCDTCRAVWRDVYQFRDVDFGEDTGWIHSQLEEIPV